MVDPEQLNNIVWIIKSATELLNRGSRLDDETLRKLARASRSENLTQESVALLQAIPYLMTEGEYKRYLKFMEIENPPLYRMTVYGHW
jgi:hypothetical protein